VIGAALGTYTIERELGRGGMGAVYVGSHSLLGRRAAIKVLLPELSRNQAVVNRFFNEARAATAIKHPGIVEIYDFGFATDGSAYIVMELLAGESLADRLRRGRLPLATAIQLARQTAAALGAAHRAGIVHRDLKPDNIYLVPDAETAIGERVKLLDFGIAKLADAGEVGRTHAGSVMGTPQYMAPEQCRGAADLDHRADLYALGCVLHEMVAGAPPFGGDAAGVVLGAHLHLPPPPLRAIAPHATAELEALVLRLLAKHPAQRPASADALVAELVAVGEPLGLSRPSGMVATPAATGGALAVPRTTLGGASGQVARTANIRRGRGPLVAGLAVLVAAGAVVAWIAMPASSPAPAAAVAPAPVAVAIDAGVPAIDGKAAFQAAMKAADGKAAREALALMPPGADRVEAERQLTGMRTRFLVAARKKVDELVDKRRCDDAQKLAAAHVRVWADAAAELTISAATCRPSKAAKSAAASGRLPPRTKPGDDLEANIARSKANIAKLASADTGMVSCDGYLRGFAALMACEKMPLDTAAWLDADAMIEQYRTAAARGEEERLKMDAACAKTSAQHVIEARKKHPECRL
jgi:tRNA A-37 threonylcarbamoyl transferase component Bud32